MAWYDAGARIKAIVGHFGSGKTEIALNAALRLAKGGEKARLIDMDIVNPFFRSAEQKDLLVSRGVEVIYPQYALTGVDVPVLGAEIDGALLDDGARVIIDVGGDAQGAAALGRFFPALSAQAADMYYVINPFRPRSETREQILALFELIEKRSRLRATGIIANPNLGAQTDASVIAEGMGLIERVAGELGLPVVCVCGVVGAFVGVRSGIEKFVVERYLVPEWIGSNED